MNSHFNFTPLGQDTIGTEENINGTHGNDTLDGGDGNDVIYGAKGDDQLMGHLGDDYVNGGKGDDSVGGGQGNDTLLGGNGNDTLHGGLGADLLSGGAGADVFSFTSIEDSTVATAGRDTMTFDTHQHDIIDLSAIDADIGTDGDQAFHMVKAFGDHAGELIKVQTDAGFLVEGDVDGDGVADFSINVHTATGLHGSDFVF